MCRTMTRSRKSRGEDTTDVLARRASNTLYPQQVTAIGKTASRHSPVPWHIRTVPTLANLTRSLPRRPMTKARNPRTPVTLTPHNTVRKLDPRDAARNAMPRKNNTTTGAHSTNKHRYRHNSLNHKPAAHGNKQHPATKSSGETNALLGTTPLAIKQNERKHTADKESSTTNRANQ